MMMMMMRMIGVGEGGGEVGVESKCAGRRRGSGGLLKTGISKRRVTWTTFLGLQYRRSWRRKHPRGGMMRAYRKVRARVGARHVGAGMGLTRGCGGGVVLDRKVA